MNKLTQRGGGFRSWSFCDKVIINLKCPLSKLSNKKIKSYFRNFDSSNNNKTKDLSVFSQIQLLNIVSASLNHVNRVSFYDICVQIEKVLYEKTSLFPNSLGKILLLD